jgi:hypothetical protein
MTHIRDEVLWVFSIGNLVIYNFKRNAGESVGWWSNIILSPRQTGFFPEGLGTSRHRRFNQVPPTQGWHRCRLPGYNALSAAIRRQVFYLRRFNPFLFRRLGFFSFSIDRIRHCAHFDTYPPGAFGCNGFHGESAWPDEAEQGLLRAHWIIGPPFVDPKSLATMSNAGGVGGWQKW